MEADPAPTTSVSTQDAESVVVSIPLGEVEDMLGVISHALWGGSPEGALRYVERILDKAYRGTTPARTDGSISPAGGTGGSSETVSSSSVSAPEKVRTSLPPGAQRDGGDDA